MKLLQTLLEATAAKSKATASDVTKDAAKITSLAKGAAAHLKKTFGAKLMDTPMAMITQHTRSHVDAALGTRLSKDDLESVTNKVLSQVKSHLNEADESADAAKITSLAKGAAAHLKKTFGAKLLDTPMAVITQHTRSHVDAALGTRLSKDELESITKKVLSQLKSHLREADETEEEGDELEEATEKKVAKKVEAYGVKGMKSTPWRKTFKSQEAFEKWCDKNEGDIDVQGHRELEESTVKEAVDTVHGVMAQILNDDLDAYEVMVRPSTPGQRAAAKIIQRMYDKFDSQFSDPEQSMLNVLEEIEAEYGPHVGKTPFESVQESKALTEARKIDPSKWYIVSIEDEVVAGPFDSSREATRALNDGTDANDSWEDVIKGSKLAERNKVEEAAKKAPASEEDDDKKKVSAKALAKSMEDDEEGEDEDVKKADASTKDKPKKIADTSIKPAELKTAYSKLSKQIQHAVDTSSAESAFELSKELRKAFKDITTEEVRQATTIWKSENN